MAALRLLNFLNYRRQAGQSNIARQCVCIGRMTASDPNCVKTRDLVFSESL
jgi:hypothetical protein